MSWYVNQMKSSFTYLLRWLATSVMFSRLLYSKRYIHTSLGPPPTPCPPCTMCPRYIQLALKRVWCVLILTLITLQMCFGTRPNTTSLCVRNLRGVCSWLGPLTMQANLSKGLVGSGIQIIGNLVPTGGVARNWWYLHNNAKKPTLLYDF